MNKLFTYAVFLALSLLLGNSAMAQNRAVMKPVTETIDFTGYGGSGQPNVNFSFSNNHPQINGQVITERLTVENTNEWGFYGSSVYQETYLQKNQRNSSSLAILSGLSAGDVVTIWGECGNQDWGSYDLNGSVELLNTTSYNYNGKDYPNSKEYRITNSGDVQIQCIGDWSGIRKITIQTTQRETPHYDYDPGYEEYDMYDEFSENDPQKWELRNYGVGSVNRWSTSYTLSSEETGFTLNGRTAKYMVLHGSKLTANNRIAIDGDAGDWRFNYGLRAPYNNNGQWANFSICNLREGDRVVFSYVGTPPRFSSDLNGNYNGSKAFADQENDGTFDEGEDTYITGGSEPVIGWSRYEYQNIYIEDHNGQQPQSGQDYRLYYTQPYVITEDGHLDIAIAPDTRIVKIKIFSDHQASMVDEYDAEKYTARFDITGELQAMEHIVPGGLEVHVGSNDASQHAHVVSSQHGPVSIINGVNGYKIPGMTLDANGNLQFQFHLENNIPETGTFYKFMPMENGAINLTFQATSMNYYSYSLRGDVVYYGDQEDYGDDKWKDEYDRPNEQTADVTCPYYLVKVDKNGVTTFTKIADLGNGEEFTYSIDDAKADETYYLYGGWNSTNLWFRGSGQGQNNLEYFPFGRGNGGGQNACGVARLLEVQFNPNKKIYPLAKWVPNGTTAVKTGSTVPNPDTYEPEFYLSDLWGYTPGTPLTVKKMAGNITKCHPYLVKVEGEHNHYRLMIDGIEFANEKDKGGTILIKIGEPDVKKNPVYTLTIAYSTKPEFDGKTGTGPRGHAWDYSAKSLNGLEWNPDGHANTPHPDHHGVFTNDLTENSKYAKTKDYGHYFKNYFTEDISNYSSKDEVLEKLEKVTPQDGGLLYEEISAGNSDWMFNYNLVNAGKLYDPLFTNKYDLEADNADLIWDTEGTVLLTSANQSVMFNEFIGADIHQSTVDPDRYVGILKGGQFRIPWLRPNDRVIIWMGTGKGAFNDQAVFNIRGAYDALHKEIVETDDYIVGGTLWNGKNGDPNYRGCYHFFAQGHEGGPADMVFKMTGGSMCKIYKILIYRGDRINTTEVVGATTDDKFLLVTTEKDPNDETEKVGTKGAASNWTLQYFGKDQKLADGSNSVNNDIIAQTGHITKSLTTDTDVESDTYNTFTYPHDFGEIGTFRVRGKDMEKNMKYVADYADHNVTVAYQETQKYPYTWDFKDMKLYNESLFEAEDEAGPTVADMPVWFDTEDEWNASYEKSSQDLSLWVASTQREGAHVLRLNSQRNQDTENIKEKDNIFQSDYYNYNGNQLWANGEVVPESKGLWFYTPDNNQNNGQWYISDVGMELDGNSDWSHKMVVPNVPKNGAVYLRMLTTKTPYFTRQFMKDNDNCVIYGPIVVRNKTNEYIFAILNTGEKQNLLLSLAGYRLLKLAVSSDFKSLDSHGWASESREHVIDPALTAYMTDKDIETCFVTEIQYNEANPTKGGKLTLVRAHFGDGLDDYTGDIVQASKDGEYGGCLLHSKDDLPVSILPKNKDKKIYGFHLFVPDMHDYANENTGIYTDNATLGVKRNTANAESWMYGRNLLVSQVSAGYISPVDGDLTNYILSNQYYVSDQGDLTGDVEAFYRVSPTKNKGLGAKSNGNNAFLQLETSKITKQSSANGFTFTFGEGGDADGINEVFGTIENTSNSIYTIDGNKLETMPTRRGLYIINGKKVVIR